MADDHSCEFGMKAVLLQDRRIVVSLDTIFPCPECQRRPRSILQVDVYDGGSLFSKNKLQYTLRFHLKAGIEIING